MQLKTRCKLYEALARGTRDFYIQNGELLYVKRDCVLTNDWLKGTNEAIQGYPPKGNGELPLGSLFSDTNYGWKIFTECPKIPIPARLGQIFHIEGDADHQVIITGMTDHNLFGVIVPRTSNGYQGQIAHTASFDRFTGKGTHGTALCVRQRSTS